MTICSNPFTAKAISTERNVFYKAEFTNGDVASDRAGGAGNPGGAIPVDSMHIATRYTTGAENYKNSYGPGFDSSQNYDVKVVGPTPEFATLASNDYGSDPGGTMVYPRVGDYMLQSVIHRDRSYLQWDSDTALGTDRPRCHHYPGHDIRVDNQRQPYLGNPRVVYDVETYVGFSIYLPSNTKTDNRRNLLCEIASEGSSYTHMSFGIDYVEVTDGHWCLRMWDNPNATTDTGWTNNPAWDFGSYADDLGKWTDWVFRVRFNPFCTDRDGNGPTNANGFANGRNLSLDHDGGILQVWKTTGDVDQDGNRNFVELTPTSTHNSPGIILPIINGRDNGGAGDPVGVGCVPYDDYDVRFNWRQYRGAWRYLSNNSPRTDTPIFQGPQALFFDALYMGEADSNGTTFQDVNPGRKNAP